MIWKFLKQTFRGLTVLVLTLITLFVANTAWSLMSPLEVQELKYADHGSEDSPGNDSTSKGIVKKGHGGARSCQRARFPNHWKMVYAFKNGGRMPDSFNSDPRRSEVANTFA